MARDELVDKFDECFGISTATEAQRKNFFDWVMAQQQAAQQSVQADGAVCDCEHKNLTYYRDGVYICGFCEKPRR